MHNFTKFLFKTAAAWTAWQEETLVHDSKNLKVKTAMRAGGIHFKY
jgi:hypothetical protein